MPDADPRIEELEQECEGLGRENEELKSQVRGLEDRVGELWNAIKGTIDNLKQTL